ncbi:serine/threonine-protein kinase [Enhygromyxa salina]|uniref:serine/threonine-protein kinase n=1 Tax=Enhygromyxa salina TaxID=215803 RepID=UPI0015E778B4|nr:serine/threonine-protein kinase [Enhygromyxa salina]
MLTDAESTFQGRPNERGAVTHASERPELDWAGDIEDQRVFALVRSRMFARSGVLRVGRYRIVRRLGAGAMGEVQLAIDEQLDRAVAVKFVHAHLAHHRFTERLRVEARALARLAHANVVHIYEVGEQHGRVFLAMEYINGQSLRDWIAQAPGWERVLSAYLEAARGLAAAHSAGVIHRDFKPDNVLRGAEGRIAVADFGLAALDRPPTADDEDPEPRPASRYPCAEASVTETYATPGSKDDGSASFVSRPGEVKGTPAYMPPEQFRGRSDARADQFALCVSIYEGLWGQRPFARRTVGEMLDGEVDWLPLTPPARARVPKWIWPLIRRGLAVNPDDRWDSVDDLIAALERGLGRRRRRARLIGSGVVALAVGLFSGVGVAWWGGAPGVEDCTNVARELADTWDRDQRARLSQALASAAESSGAAWLTDSEAPIVAGLDRWRDRWLDSRAELCRGRAGGDPVVLDRVGACLERHHRSTQALVGLMLAADLPTLREAPRAVVRLEDPRACASEARQGGPPDPPRAVAAEVEEVRRELALVEADLLIAHHATALASIDELGPRVAALGYLPLSAELAHARGRALLDGGHTADGLEALEQAADLGEAGHHDRVVADSWRRMAGFAATTKRDLDAGRRWLRRADAAARRVGVAPLGPLGPADMARLDFVRGNLQLLEGQFAAAFDQLEPLVAVFEDEVDHQDLLFAAHTTTALGVAVLNQGDRDRAIELFGRSLGLLERVHGSGHPDVALAAYNLGQLSLEAGDAELAQIMLERAVQIWALADELELRNVGRAQLVLGQLALAQGRTDAALDHATAAATAFERATRMPIEQAEAASLAAAAHYFLAQAGPAVLAYRRAIQGYANAYGEDDVYVAYFRVGLGWALLADGQIEAARVEFEAALVVIEAKDGGSTQAVDARFGLISVDLASHQLEAARARLARFDGHELAGMEAMELELFRGLLALRGDRADRADHAAGAAALASARAHAKTVASGEATLAILLASVNATDEERRLAGE